MLWREVWRKRRVFRKMRLTFYSALLLTLLVPGGLLILISALAKMSLHSQTENSQTKRTGQQWPV